MIYDSLSNFPKYSSVHRLFPCVAEYINSHNLHDLSIGEHQISDGIKAIVDEYQTKEISESAIECHRKYIDIQVIISGKEYMGTCRKEDCVEKEYSEKDDCQELKGEAALIKFEQNYFMIFFPEDGHMPGIKYKDTNRKVKKVVFKILA
jgi:YhcH/YjgK/YiaL family protein